MSSENENPRSALLYAAHISMLLPPDQQSFRDDLAYFIKDCAYKSPEIVVHSSSWLQLDSIMKKYIIEIDEEWKEKVIDLYTGKTTIN